MLGSQGKKVGAYEKTLRERAPSDATLKRQVVERK